MVMWCDDDDDADGDDDDDDANAYGDIRLNPKPEKLLNPSLQNHMQPVPKVHAAKFMH
jgi:hypothetical protein